MNSVQFYQPSGYIMPVGKTDSVRAESLNLIFDEQSLEFFPFDKVKEGDNLLFAGCGNGELVVQIAQKIHQSVAITAFDIKEEQLECARQFATEKGVSNIKWIRHDVNEIETLQEQFDIVHSRFLLNHLSNAEIVVEKMCSVIALGGIFISEDMAGCKAEFVSGASEHEASVKIWHEFTAAQHALQKSDVAFGEKLPQIVQEIGLAITKQLKPNPTATTSKQKNIAPEGMKTALVLIPDPRISIAVIQSCMTPLLQRAIQDFTNKRGERAEPNAVVETAQSMSKDDILAFVEKLIEYLTKMRDDPDCGLVFPHFTQIEAQKNS